MKVFVGIISLTMIVFSVINFINGNFKTACIIMYIYFGGTFLFQMGLSANDKK